MSSPEDRGSAPEADLSLAHWEPMSAKELAGRLRPRSWVDCGWGRVLFGQTYASQQELLAGLRKEREGERDLAMYVRDPHVVVAAAPHEVFLDPSYSFRLPRERLEPPAAGEPAVHVRPATAADQNDINRMYQRWGMVPLREGYCATLDPEGPVVVLVAEADRAGQRIVGVVMGVDHTKAFDDPDEGSSLWALAVDADNAPSGTGRELVVALARRFFEAGRQFMDLSVMHDNDEAIPLYEKLGFERIPAYCVKLKNSYNEALYAAPPPGAGEELNVYAEIIVHEARRRGIRVDVEDAAAGLFTLSFGGRSIACRESLSDLTSAVAMSRCADKRLTARLLRRAGLDVPEQIDPRQSDPGEFLRRHGSVVVKPVAGEQGRGIHVDIRSEAELEEALEAAAADDEAVLVEQYARGEELRIIVIDGEVVAAARRARPSVIGDGVHTVRELIEKASRRRAAATAGEARIPIDAETRRCVANAGSGLDEVLPAGEQLVVRNTANLHTGGSLVDVTGELHERLASAACQAAEVLHTPVVGLDFIVDAPDGPGYVIIEANERPGLANHEPQPTAERFVDLLFPETEGPFYARTASP